MADLVRDARLLKIVALIAVAGSAAGTLSIVLEPKEPAPASRGGRIAVARSDSGRTTPSLAAPAIAPRPEIVAPLSIDKNPVAPIAPIDGNGTATSTVPNDPSSATPSSPSRRESPTSRGLTFRSRATQSAAPEAPIADAAAERRARDVAAILEDLADSNPRHRINALRQARDLDIPEVMGDVKRLALEDKDPVAQRFAVQALALDDHPQDYQEVFLHLLDSPDWTIKANATLGLARLGDESAQADLLALMQKLKADRSSSATGVARAIESPDLHGPRIVSFYRARSTDSLLTSAERASAATILAAKVEAASTLAAR